MVNHMSHWRTCTIPLHEDDEYMDVLVEELQLYVLGDDSYPALILIRESKDLIVALRDKIRTLEKYVKDLPNEQK